ncbi:23S rRNA (guanosine(2251)-2'-O)-methyltransferase RlmB [Paludibaculum fermentans]|uniref:23S rRNA (Guanosine(2251)-2'-O)-methyltransferase RlmB n=1 Tax=Paludibaculum fermentans TaxID=1473598 RepID=A0A7S7NKU3_PALFE|nr:23S rRNA (guanosine(2251)-2'-O)-methyltransferase RlmB [Paludibaculum fermentans]QOY85395.1 23S rRNA (guanosine(2251)-2'-O)-methyltransferase RlmB [Paludibaculum fermentans]
MAFIAGIHPVREALRAGQSLDRVHIVKGAAGPRLQEIIELCRAAKLPVRFDTREALDRLVKGLPHQGVVAVPSTQVAHTLESVLNRPGLLVVLDGVEDPHNLGAIVRTAHAAGATAVVIPERRAVGLTETVAKAAAGALALLPVVKVNNINRALETLKQHGFWIYGVDERGKQNYSDTEFTNPAAIVLGGEGRGLHEQTRHHCDFLIRIPMAGQIASLNVSVAAGVVLFDWRRRNPPTP